MDARNCRSCGTLFNYISGPPICTKCKKKLEEKFTEVKEYLDGHPRATISVVSEEIDVSVKQTKQWIREERLSLSDATDAGVTCETCGKPICSGRFCDKCKAKMHNELSGVIAKPVSAPAKKKDHDGNRMRFLQ